MNPIQLALFLLATALVRDSVAADADDLAAELASFQIADGFQANLFASEKDGVVKPIQIRFDPRGRVWVIGSTVYPQIQPGQIPNDKLLILEDTDGDGRSDKTTVFADGLMIPTGLELGDGGAYVGHGTELLFLKDTDGDDKADVRRVLLRGFGTGDNHQNINSFRWGPGGELWFSQGLHIRSHVETPWGIARLEQAGIWRLWPRRLKLEGFYGSEHEPQNPWGFVFTDWGEPIVLAGNNSSPIYPVPGLTFRHRDDAPALIWKNGNGRKVSGGDIVGTKHFPEYWQGALIVGGYINNAVWALKISDDGAGFILEDLPPLIRSTSRSFRPVDVKFGPDGALYLCDWYNPIIGHYQASFRHPDRDKTHGRIWRITAKGRSLTSPPKLAGATLAELLDDLKSTDRWTRYQAKRALAEKPRDQVSAALNVWTAQPDLSEHALVEALGVYQSHEIVAPELLARLCRAVDSGARSYAAGAIGPWADRLPNALELLQPLVADENPRVRLHAVVACSYVPKSQALEAALQAADRPTDRFLSYALNQTVFALKPYWLPEFKSGRLHLENQPSRLGLLVRADGTPDTLQTVRELLRSTSLDAAARETYWRLLAEMGNAEDLATVLNLTEASIQSRLIPAVATAARIRKIRPAGNSEKALGRLVQSERMELRSEALKLAGILKLESFRSVAESAADDVAADVSFRRAAIESLGSFGGADSLDHLSRLANTGSLSIRSAAVATLAGSDTGRAVGYAAELLSSLSDEAVVIEIFSAILRRQGGAEILANALKAKAPSPQAAEIGLRLMNAGGRRHEGLAQILTQAAGWRGQGPGLTVAALSGFIDEVRTAGDASRGEAIFGRAELGCATCHTVNGQGGKIGPDLSALGTAQPVDFIIGAILDPQKEIKEGFVSISVATTGGEEYQGYQVGESPDELVLRDVLQNREIRIRRDAIKDRRQNGSVMPSGLADTLIRAEFRDLVRFLSDLGKPK